MKTKVEKKEFALLQLAPYLADPSTCGYDEQNDSCLYLTDEGKMCVAGKNMLDPELFDNNISIENILTYKFQEDVFKPEVVDILDTFEWNKLQNIHDNIATNNFKKVEAHINELNLFTFEELQESANLLKKDLVD